MMTSLIRCLTACALLSLTTPDLTAQDGPVLAAPALAERQVQREADEFIVPPAPSDPGESASSPDERDDVPTPPAPAPEGPPARDDRPVDGRRENYLGVTMDRVPDALAAQFADVLDAGQGLLVRSVAAGSAAEQAGLRPNDVLVAYNGEPLTSPDELKRLVVTDEPGATVELTIIRSARPQTVTVTLGDREVAPPPARVPADFGAAPLPAGPFPVDIHLPGRRSIVIDRYGLRSPWVAVDWGSSLAGRRFRALTPDGRQFDVEVRVHSGRRWR